MKKNSTSSKVILVILDVIFGISFICMISGYYEFSTFTKITLWICFVVFMIKSIMKLINQISEMILIMQINNLFTLINAEFTLLHKSKNSVKEKKQVLQDALDLITRINEVLKVCNLKKYNKEHLIEMLVRINSLIASVSAE